jgi:uncharacterized delta-60 repeat protein
VGGAFTSFNTVSEKYLAAINGDGSLNTAVAQTGSGLHGQVDNVLYDSVGRIVVAFWSTLYNTTTENYVARLNSNGTLDPTFNPVGTGLNAGQTFTSALDSSGRIVLGGQFTSYNGTSEPYVARINTDGSLDSTFNPVGTGLNNYLQSLAIDSTGRIIVGGRFTSYNGTSAPYLARLNTDGSLDSTFSQMGTGLSSYVTSLLITPSGQIIIGGAFANYNGTTLNNIARINSDGSLDSTFNPGTGFNSLVNNVAIDASGRVLVGGLFTFFNGTSTPYIARLNTNGTLDTTFATTGSGFSNQVATIQVDAYTGKIWVGGYFTSYNGISAPYLVRLNSDGTLDTTFSTSGVGFNGPVYSILLTYNLR